MKNPKDILDFTYNYPSPTKSLSEVINSLSARIAVDPAASVKSIRLDRDTNLLEPVAKWLSFPNYKLNTENVTIAASGYQILTAIILGCTQPGDKIACESITYGGWLNVVHFHQRQSVPIEMDEEGMIPEALDAATKKTSLWGIYVMPSMHNPRALTMSLGRRKALVEVCRKHDLWIIDDDAYRFLNPTREPSFAHLMPEKAFWLQSLTKLMFASLKTAFLVAPTSEIPKLTELIRTLGHSPSTLTLPWILDLLGSPLMEKVILEKQTEAKARQAIVRNELSGFKVEGLLTAYHLWMTLPEKWTSSLQAAEAIKAEGVEVSAGSTCSPDGTELKPGLRLALGKDYSHETILEGARRIRQALA